MTSANMRTLRTILGGGSTEFNENRTSEAFEQRMREVYDPRVEVHEPPSLPYGGVHRGVDNWLRVRTTMMATWEQKLDVLNIYEDTDNNVIVLNYLMDWTCRSTGRNFRMPAIEVLTFRDAKIAKVEFYPQDAGLMVESLQPSPADG